MSYVVDKPPTEDQLLQTGQRVWELPTHKPTLTATRGAYKPYSTYVSFFFHFFRTKPPTPKLPLFPILLRDQEGRFGVVREVCIGEGNGEVVDVLVCDTMELISGNHRVLGVVGRSRNIMLGCPRQRRGDEVIVFWKRKEL